MATFVGSIALAACGIVKNEDVDLTIVADPSMAAVAPTIRNLEIEGWEATYAVGNPLSSGGVRWVYAPKLTSGRHRCGVRRSRHAMRQRQRHQAERGDQDGVRGGDRR
jgi:hypothetical protein